MFDVAPYIECINDVHSTTLQSVIRNESGGNPLAINVNIIKGKPRPKYRQPKSRKQAIALAKRYIALGHSVDLGLTQVNSRNLPHYRVSIADMFDPCTNIKVGSTILYEAYQRALKVDSDKQSALLKALSIYNTGNMRYGFKNGYVRKYTHGKRNYHKTSHSINYAQTTIDIGDLYDTPKKRHTVTTDDMGFEERQRRISSGDVVEFTLDELKQMGATLDDEPMTEEDYEVDQNGED